MAPPVAVRSSSRPASRRLRLFTALVLGGLTLSSCRLTGSESLGSLSQSSSIRTSTSFLSDQTPLSATNGLGPYEKNRSNGEAKAGDGSPLSITGKTYARGLGVQADSALEYNVGAQCRTFSTQVGLDDSSPAGSAVTFSVFADGRMLERVEMAAGGAPRALSVDIQGVERLKLVVESRGAARINRADWAEARVEGCVTYNGPIEVGPSASSPIVITGNYRSDDPSVPAIRISTSQPVIIKNCTLAGRGHLIRNARSGANVRVENCRGYGLNPNVWMATPGRFLSIEAGVSVRVENSFLKNTGGIYLLGGSTKTTSVKILRNRALNIDGRRSDGAGGWLQPKPNDNPEKFFRAQFAQFNAIEDIPDAEIAWNRVENEPGYSRVEDNISIYQSSGTAASRIRVHHNLIKGAYHYPTKLQSYSGGGIITDGCLSRHVEISDNTVLETSNHGIAIAGGEYVSIRDNKVYNTGLLPDGSFSGGNDSGIYVRWARNCSQQGINFSSNVIARNSIGFGQPTSSDQQRRQDLYIAKASSGVPLASAVDNSSALPSDSCLVCADSELIQKAISDWEQQAAANGVAVGLLPGEVQ